MSNVKFRGLGWIEVSPNNFKEDFIYGGYYKHDEICDYIVVNDFEFKSFKSGTLGQFTGLQDKNGVDIYVGDIVSQHTEWNGGYCSDEYGETESIGIVKIYPSKGVVITKVIRNDLTDLDVKWEKSWDINLRSCRSTVLGNIHKDLDLLSKIKNG